MPDLTLSPAGLLMATAMSVTNVFTDVARKRALDGRELIPATFWMRVAVTVCFGVVETHELHRELMAKIIEQDQLFQIVDVSPDRMRYTAYSIDGAVADEFELRKGGTRSTLVEHASTK